MKMVKTYEESYIEILKKLLNEGIKKDDRTGTGTLSLFGEGFKIDISEKFPLLTTKKVSFKNIAYELLWFLGCHYNGIYKTLQRTNIKYLVDNNVKIWDDWPYKQYIKSGGEKTIEEYRQAIKKEISFAKLYGNLGPVYGHQWCAWGERRGTDKLIEDDNGNHIMGKEYSLGINQIKNLINGLKNNPFSRRHVLSAWNVGQIDQMQLPPCHLLTIFNVFEKDGVKYLNCDFKMRSNDFFLGNPYNVASYALLTNMLALECDMKPMFLNFSATDLHLYLNHIDQAKEQIKRFESGDYNLHPQIEIKKAEDFFNYGIENFNIIDYKPMGAIKAPIAV